MNDPTAEDGLEETEQINVVPLADLTLVLLIILMVLSPMISQSMIHVAAPAVGGPGGKIAAPPTADEPPAPLLIAVTSKGYTLNNESAPDLEYLMAALALRLHENAKRPVIVTADEGIPVGKVVEVLDSAKRHGAQQISLVKSTRLAP